MIIHMHYWSCWHSHGRCFQGTLQDLKHLNHGKQWKGDHGSATLASDKFWYLSHRYSTVDIVIPRIWPPNWNGFEILWYDQWNRIVLYLLTNHQIPILMIKSYCCLHSSFWLYRCDVFNTNKNIKLFFASLGLKHVRHYLTAPLLVKLMTTFKHILRHGWIFAEIYVATVPNMNYSWNIIN